jgi:hypothetical protein
MEERKVKNQEILIGVQVFLLFLFCIFLFFYYGAAQNGRYVQLKDNPAAGPIMDTRTGAVYIYAGSENGWYEMRPGR